MTNVVEVVTSTAYFVEVTTSTNILTSIRHISIYLCVSSASTGQTTETEGPEATTIPSMFNYENDWPYNYWVGSSTTSSTGLPTTIGPLTTFTSGSSMTSSTLSFYLDFFFKWNLLLSVATGGLSFTSSTSGNHIILQSKKSINTFIIVCRNINRSYWHDSFDSSIASPYNIK